MNILPGNDISTWERINDLANIFSIGFGLLTTGCAIVLFVSGAKLQTLKDAKINKTQNEANIKIAQANSTSEIAKANAAQADEKAAKASLGAELAKESASKANERTEILQNKNKQLDIELSKLTQENVKLRLDLEKEAAKRVKVQERLTPRQLGEQLTFANGLKAFAGMKVDVKYMDDVEAESIAGQLMFIFNTAGWEIRSHIKIKRQTSGHYYGGGIIIGSKRAGISNPQDHSQQAGEALHNELKLRGILSRTGFASNLDLRNGEFPLNSIEVIVALKPEVELER